MLRLVRTNAKDIHFHKLVKALDANLAITDGEDHAFYNQYNGIENIHHVVLGYLEEVPIACGAIKKYSEEYMEVKRMFVVADYRGKAYGKVILDELEQWSRELGYTHCILETGHKQPAAISLYKKAGYEITKNYGQYAGVENSICFRKKV